MGPGPGPACSRTSPLWPAAVFYPKEKRDTDRNRKDGEKDRDEKRLKEKKSQARRRDKLQRVANATSGSCRNLHSSTTTGDSSKAATVKAQKEVRAAHGPHPVATKRKILACRFLGTTAGCEHGDACGFQHTAQTAEKNRARETRQQQSIDGTARDPRRLAENQGGRRVGVVRRWIDDKAFGFIGVSGGAKDLYFHKNNTVRGEAIAAGTSVEYIAQVDKRSKNDAKAAYQVYPLN